MSKCCHLLFLLATATLLFACSRDTREADIKECGAETQSHLSQDQSARKSLADRTESERHDAIGSIIAACMEQRGYKHDDGAMTDERCVDDVDYNAFCYLKGA